MYQSVKTLILVYQLSNTNCLIFNKRFSYYQIKADRCSFNIHINQSNPNKPKGLEIQYLSLFLSPPTHVPPLLIHSEIIIVHLLVGSGKVAKHVSEWKNKSSGMNPTHPTNSDTDLHINYKSQS